MRWRRWLGRLAILIVVLGAVAWVTLNWILIRPPSYQPTADVGPVRLLEWPAHDAIYQSTEFPYVLSISKSSGALEYVGMLHVSDATDPMLTELEARWEQFQPTVALCEGRARRFRFAKRPTTGTLGESELTRMLAYQSGVPLYTLEPTYEAEVAGLLEHFDAPLVATYLTLRVYVTEAKGQLGDQDSLASHLLSKRTDVEGLRGTFDDVAQFDTHWRQAFPAATDWRQLESTESIALLREIGDRSREVRGRHMINALVELVGRGERVFAVVGASHVIRQEPALRELLEH